MIFIVCRTQFAPCGAICSDGVDVPSVGYPAFGYVVDRASCIDRMRGSDEYHQFYGWSEWNHGGIFFGGACSSAVDEPKDTFYGEFVFDCHDPVRTGVLPVQFPS